MNNQFIVRGPKPALYKPLFINPEFPVSQTMVGKDNGGRQLIDTEYGGVPEAYLGAWPPTFSGYIGRNAKGIYGSGLSNMSNKDIKNEVTTLSERLMEIDLTLEEMYLNPWKSTPEYFKKLEEEAIIILDRLREIEALALEGKGGGLFGFCNKEKKQIELLVQELEDEWLSNEARIRHLENLDTFGIFPKSSEQKLLDEEFARLVNRNNKINELLYEKLKAGDLPYCGIDKPRKGKKQGTLKECVESKQVRLYGLKKVDSKLLNSLRNKRGKLDLKKLKLEYVKLSIKLNLLNKQLKNNKLTKSERNNKLKEISQIKDKFRLIQMELGIQPQQKQQVVKKKLQLPKDINKKIGLNTLEEYAKISGKKKIKVPSLTKKKKNVAQQKKINIQDRLDDLQLEIEDLREQLEEGIENETINVAEEDDIRREIIKFKKEKQRLLKQKN